MNQSFKAFSHFVLSFFGGRAVKKTRAVVAAPEASRPTRLSKILPLTGWFEGESRCAFPLLCGEMSPAGLSFKTRACLKEGQSLYLEMLLQPWGRMRVHAEVVWILPCPGGYHGQLRMQTDPAQQKTVQEYLARQARDHR